MGRLAQRRPRLPANPRYTPLEEVLALMQCDLIEIGAHTATHSAHSALPGASQRGDFQRSSDLVQNALGRRVSSFAYLFGCQSDYTVELIGIVQRAEFTGASPTAYGAADRWSDIFGLPHVRVVG
jgi:peptidoglycan/xylan/chitin deacetylase (PgdA/CDA1 family)